MRTKRLKKVGWVVSKAKQNTKQKNVPLDLNLNEKT